MSKKQHKLRVFCIMTTIALMIQTAYAMDAKQVFRQTRDSVVLVMSFDKNNQPLAIGSGFFVGDGKVIVTNHHVIENAATVKIKTTKGKVFKIRNSLGTNLRHDITLLEVPSVGKPLSLSERTPDIGEDIVAIGNPKGLESTISRGIISGIRDDSGKRHYQITAPISPGSSGGPIVDEKGKVLGVATFYVDGGQNLNFAVPASYIHSLLDSPRLSKIIDVAKRSSSNYRRIADERVSVSEASIGMLNNSYGVDLEASIINKTDYTIKNVRLVATFYRYDDLDLNNPLHFRLIEVDDVIPAGLGKRFQRKDDILRSKHSPNDWSDPICTIQKNKCWHASFRVLDYDIAGRNNELIPVFN